MKTTLRTTIATLFLSTMAFATVTVDGYAYLENQSDHSGVTITFVRTAPSALTETTTTDANGYYTAELETGIYDIAFTKDEYYPEVITGQNCYSSVTLDDVTLNEHISLINVPADFATIQGAIDMALDGDTILVQPGTYVENISYGGGIVLGSMFLITQDTSYISSTIIDGSLGDVVASIGSGTITGFSIKNGNDRGIICSGSAKISHMIISNNTGGGIYCQWSSPTISHTIISNNTASIGAGIKFIGGSPSISHTIISNNTASNDGGGIYLYESYPSISRTLISNNLALNNGGGIYATSYFDYRADLKNVVLSNNTASNGGGIYCDDDAQFPNLVNSIISGNNGNIGMFLSTWDTPNISYSVIYDNENGNFNINTDYLGVNVTTNTNGDSVDSYLNMQLDPLFVDEVNGSYNLQDDSPCIDAGFNDFNNDGLQDDLDYYGETIDIGVYENESGLQNYSGPLFYVSPLGLDNNDGSEISPFQTIQHAINYIPLGDTVLVLPGNYTENINYNGKSIVVGSMFLITQDTSYISATIIDGNQGIPIYFSGNYNETTVLSGFSITNGNVGIYCYNYASPTLKNLNILNNQGSGLLCLYYSSPTVSNTLITNNFANNSPYQNGGGVSCFDLSSPILENVTITNNTAPSNGGGIFFRADCSPVIINSIIANNFGNYGIYSEGNIENTNISISFSNIFNNENGNFYNLDYNVGTNNSFNANADSSDIYNNIQMNPLFCNSDFNNYYLNINSPCIGAGENGVNMGAFDIGCATPIYPPSGFTLLSPSDNAQISIDQSNMNDGYISFFWEPSSDENGDSLTYLFRAISTEMGDFNLDTSATSFELSYLDILGELIDNNFENASIEWTVFVTDSIDTVEASNTPFTLTIDGSGALDVIQEGVIPNDFALHQNYPNPFNPVTTINYDLPEQAHVSIMIYDIMGREIRHLVNGIQEPGFKTTIWDASNNLGEPVSAGMYLYRIQTDRFSKTMKMVLLK